MNAKRLCLGVTLAMACTAFLSACGGGGSSTSATGSSGATTKTAVKGPITGFGSVFVGGVEYDVSGAKVTVNGAPGTDADLEVGMVVTLKGDKNGNGQGSASEIDFDRDVHGPITSIDTVNSTLVVLGQTVVVDANTVFGDKIGSANGLTALAVGNVIDVSGFLASDGSIHATRIEREAAAAANGEELEVKGVISGLDTAAQTFSLNSQVVDYSGAQLSNIPGASLANGQFVKAEGTLNGGQLAAAKVEGKQEGVPGSEGEDTQIKGLVTAMSSGGAFTVNGQNVKTTADTEYEHGTAASVALNTPVEVEGTFDASGALTAETVTFQADSDLGVRDAVAAVDATASTVTTALGLTFKVDGANTTWEDDSAAAERYFNIGKLAVGDRVEIKAYKDGSGSLVATRVQRLNSSTSGCDVEGPVDAVNQPNLTELGLTAITDASTSFTVNDTAVTAATFFGTVAAGGMVELKANTDAACANGQISPSEVSLDN